MDERKKIPQGIHILELNFLNLVINYRVKTKNNRPLCLYKWNLKKYFDLKTNQKHIWTRKKKLFQWYSYS